MKKIAAICLKMVFLLVVVSCSKSSKQKDDESGTTSVASSVNMMIDPCPPGTHPVWTLGFDDFNFHRPINGCTRGFWFCFKNSHWYMDCVANNPYAKITNNTAIVWFEIVNNRAVIHFPRDLKNTRGYTVQDLATFSVDEEYEVYTGITLKTGSYAVSDNGTELIVAVDLK
jgi:hypothetical protein